MLYFNDVIKIFVRLGIKVTKRLTKLFPNILIPLRIMLKQQSLFEELYLFHGLFDFVLSLCQNRTVLKFTLSG